LDWYSGIRVDFNTSQPIYILIVQDSLVPLVENSTFSNENGVVQYRIPVDAFGNYFIKAKGFDGIASVRVGLQPSIVTRNKPYEVWGQIIYYGGTGLLIFSIVVLAISWLRRKPVQSKQPLKTAVVKKIEKKR
jgi:hypothetical protein